jgi:hypothetical protein
LPIKTQVKLWYALTAVHNFINQFNPDDMNLYTPLEDEEIDKKDARVAEKGSEVGMNEWRDEIAQLMWRRYCEVTGQAP